MTSRLTPAPRSGVLEAGQTNDVGGVVSVGLEYTTATLHRTPLLTTWLRCYTCHRGFFAAGAPGSQPCPACAGGCLRPVALWALRMDAAPPGMLHLTVQV